jgi:hypothetical protein
MLLAALARCGPSPAQFEDSAGAGTIVMPTAEMLDAGTAVDADAGSHDAGSHGSPDGSVPDSGTPPPPAGPIVRANGFTTLYAVSDLHGHYAQLAALLLKYGLIASMPTKPSTMEWAGGDATLVVDGDMIDKGPDSLEVVEAVMALEQTAPAQGGRVIALLGNHEAEFFADPGANKFTGTDGIDAELQSQTPAITAMSFADGTDPRAMWIRGLPFGARVGSWFFCHAGDTGGNSVEELDALLTAALSSTTGWGSNAIVGTTSLLESKNWYTSSIVSANAGALGVKHIAMGHDPNAFTSTGLILEKYQGGLFKLDTGLGSGIGDGAFLRVRHQGAQDVAEALLPDGTVTALWTGTP